MPNTTPKPQSLRPSPASRQFAASVRQGFAALQHQITEEELAQLICKKTNKHTWPVRLWRRPESPLLLTSGSPRLLAGQPRPPTNHLSASALVLLCLFSGYGSRERIPAEQLVVALAQRLGLSPSQVQSMCEEVARATGRPLIQPYAQAQVFLTQVLDRPLRVTRYTPRPVPNVPGLTVVPDSVLGAFVWITLCEQSRQGPGRVVNNPIGSADTVATEAEVARAVLSAAVKLGWQLLGRQPPALHSQVMAQWGLDVVEQLPADQKPSLQMQKKMLLAFAYLVSPQGGYQGKQIPEAVRDDQLVPGLTELEKLGVITKKQRLIAGDTLRQERAWAPGARKPVAFGEFDLSGSVARARRARTSRRAGEPSNRWALGG